MKDFAQVGTTKRILNGPRLDTRALFLRLRGFVITAVLLFLTFLTALFLLSLLWSSLAPWKGKEPLTVAILSSSKENIRKHVSILRVDPVKKRTQLFVYPDDALVRTPKAGRYPISALFGLYSLDHEPTSTFIRTLSRATRIDVHAFLMTQTHDVTGANVASTVRESLLMGKMSGSLSFYDRFALASYLFSHPIIDVQDIGKEVASDDPHEVLESLSYDHYIADAIHYPTIEQEGVTIALINVSGVSRLAATAARLFGVFGCSVLSLTDSTPTIEKSQILVSREQLKSTQTLALLARYIDADIRVDPTRTAQERSDVVILLGINASADFTP